MNCVLCQKELDAYREGRLPEGIRVQVEAHLEHCEECAQSDYLLSISNRVIEQEKSLQSNPFILTRIMAGIQVMEPGEQYTRHIPAFQKVLKPVLISVSIAAAIFIGVMAGNIYLSTQPANNLPVEMLYMNDAALESVELFSKL